jgi:hypothetical protein
MLRSHEYRGGSRTDVRGFNFSTRSSVARISSVPGFGWTFGRPLIPRAQIHHRFGEKRADIEVVRIFLPNRAHASA